MALLLLPYLIFAATLLKPKKIHQRVRKFARQNSINWSIWANISIQKSTLARKKYTTAGYVAVTNISYAADPLF